MVPDTSDDSRTFGLWPTVAGIGIGLAIIAVMFGLATGFS